MIFFFFFFCRAYPSVCERKWGFKVRRMLAGLHNGSYACQATMQLLSVQWQQAGRCMVCFCFVFTHKLLFLTHPKTQKHSAWCYKITESKCSTEWLPCCVGSGLSNRLVYQVDSGCPIECNIIGSVSVSASVPLGRHTKRTDLVTGCFWRPQAVSVYFQWKDRNGKWQKMLYDTDFWFFASSCQLCWHKHFFFVEFACCILGDGRSEVVLFPVSEMSLTCVQP